MFFSFIFFLLTFDNKDYILCDGFNLILSKIYHNFFSETGHPLHFHQTILNKILHHR